MRVVLWIQNIDAIFNLPCCPELDPQITGDVSPVVPVTVNMSPQADPSAVAVGPLIVKVSKSNRTAQTSENEYVPIC